MLTQLSTVKTRLGLTDTKDDANLNLVINAVSALFEKACNRRFARTTQAIEEFDGDETEIRVSCYPVESVVLFEIKDSENQGWHPLGTSPDFLIRRGSVISLHSKLGHWRQRCRVTFCGGYVLPGDVVAAGQTALPEDIEQACVEQVACWYLNRNNVGTLSITNQAISTVKMAQGDLLPTVKAILKRHVRWLV